MDRDSDLILNWLRSSTIHGSLLFRISSYNKAKSCNVKVRSSSVALRWQVI